MELNIYQVDAFAPRLFQGNPAAVIPLTGWLSDTLLQNIAAENNLAETAFIVPLGKDYEIRWFTPKFEVPLCGHATLAAAHVLFHEMGYPDNSIRFISQSGDLLVAQDSESLILDFPAVSYEVLTSPPKELFKAFGDKVECVLVSHSDPNYFLVMASEQDVISVSPDMALLSKLHPYGVVLTAPAAESDCVSRYFLPSFGIPEDPVTGSIHCVLAPYWAKQLNKGQIHARQASMRGGEIRCTLNGDRVLLKGMSHCFLKGKIFIPDEIID